MDLRLDVINSVLSVIEGKVAHERGLLPWMDDVEVQMFATHTKAVARAVPLVALSELNSSLRRVIYDRMNP